MLSQLTNCKKKYPEADKTYDNLLFIFFQFCNTGFQMNFFDNQPYNGSSKQGFTKKHNSQMRRME